MTHIGLFSSIVAISILSVGLGCSSSGATGSGGGGGSPTSSSSGGGAPSCQDQPFAAWSQGDSKLLSLAVSAAGPALLVEEMDGLHVLGDGGKKDRKVMPKDPDHYAYFGKLWVKGDGTVCAAYMEQTMSGKESPNMFVACGEDGPIDTALTPDTAGGSDFPLFPVEGPMGDSYVYAASFAAVTLFLGHAGNWSRVELFESSISYPGGAVSFGGQAVACFISESGRTSLAIDSKADGPKDTGAKSSSCRIATDGTSLWVTADDRVAKLSGTMDKSFSTSAVKGLEGAQFLSVAAHAGNAWVLGYTNGSVQVADLATGAPVTWDIPAGSATGATLVAGPDGGLTLAKTDDKGQVVVGTKCL